MRLYLSILLMLVAGSLCGAQNRVDDAIQKKRYRTLGRLVRKQLGKKLTLKELEALAKAHNNQPLIRAINATRALKKYQKSLKLRQNRLLETALFLETTKKKSRHLAKEKTHLPYSLEYDAANNARFIILKNRRAYLGEGAFKKVYKAIHYDSKTPKVVARAQEHTKSTKEHKFTKKFHNVPGIFKTLGFCKYKRHGRYYRSIYSKLYKPGSLHEILEKKTSLSTYEKMKMAQEILEGLSNMHAKGIVHCDLNARNYLVDIPKGKPGRRRVSATISDLGRAEFVKQLKHVKVQGNTKFTPPEGLFKGRVKGKGYFKSDIFAAGCVLYWLHYGKIAPWLDRSYVHVHGSEKKRYRAQTRRIKRATQKRRAYLAKKGSKRSAKESFELLILKMLYINPDKRGTAQEISAKMNRIFQAL